MAENTFSRGQAAQPLSQAGPAGSRVTPQPETAYGRPSVGDPAQKQKHRRKQKKVAYFMLAAVLLLCAAGYGIYYVISAPQRARAALELGKQKMGPATYKEALGHFNRAIEIAPDLAEAYLNRGFAEKALSAAEAGDAGMQERAAIDFEKALDLDSSLTPAHDELGQIYAARGDTSKALEHFSQSIKVKATPNGYYQRGQLYEKLGEHEKALEDFNLAIAELTDAPYVYFARAVVREKLGDAEGSKTDRARALELSIETGNPGLGVAGSH